MSQTALRSGRVFCSIFLFLSVLKKSSPSNSFPIKDGVSSLFVGDLCRTGSEEAILVEIVGKF